MKKIRLIVLLLAGTIPAFGAQGTFTLEDYMLQVKAQGPDFKSTQASAEGLEKQSHQMDLTYSPQLVASYNHLDDQAQQSNVMSPSRTMSDSAGISLIDKLPFGPSVAVGYSFNNINLAYPSVVSDSSFGSLLSLSSYYQLSPVVSLSVPLFKDFSGTQTRAGVHKVQYQLESASKGAAFMREQTLFNAKTAYWNLVLARERIKIQQDTLDRTQKIWNWTKLRVKRNLADPTDALPAEAAVRVAELNLQASKESERSARLEFNRYRNVEKDDVTEPLESLEDSLVRTKVEIPADLPKRLDLKAAELTAEQQKAAYDEAHQNIYPDITAYASWRGNGLDPTFGTANQMAVQNTYPTYNVGAQFTLPLDVFTASRVAEGYKLNLESARLSLKNKQIEVGQQWKDLQEKMRDLDNRLAMVTQIEGIQKNKANQEKKRLELGRTTQYQLLSYENDYSLSRLNRMGLILEKLILLAQAQWWLATEKDAQF
jgi:outer membrane protein TolC